jgi:hypothetical protein
LINAGYSAGMAIGSADQCMIFCSLTHCSAEQ